MPPDSTATATTNNDNYNNISPLPPAVADELQDEATNIKPYHFVFAYGSLICKKSRAITAPTLADKEAIPVQVSHVERVWAKRTKRGMTAMGVRFRPDAKCTGVLLPVTESELARFDKREEGYDRYQIPLDHVEEIPFLAKKNHYEKMDYEHADVVFADDTSSSSTTDRNNKNDTITDSSGAEHKVFVWIYVQRYDCPADGDFPIAQSYVDIILRGCMNISQEFARNFIETTVGWSPEEVYGEGNDDDDVEDSDNEEKEEDEGDDDGNEYCKRVADLKVHGEEDKKEEETKVEKDVVNNYTTDDEGAHWVDDREEPIYMRADPVYSEKKADVIDQLLEDHIPEHLDNREPITEEEEEGKEDIVS